MATHMDQILANMSKTGSIIGDMIITGADDEEHLHNAESVLKRFNIT